MTTPLARISITQSDFFADWPEAALARVVDAAEVSRHENGHCLHRSGDPAEFLYIIASGALSLSSCSASGRRFTPVVQLPGDCHGIGPVICAAPHIFTAMCKNQTEVVRIPAPLIRELLRQDGRLALAAFSAFHRRYLYALAQFETSSICGLQARIAMLLASISARGHRAHLAATVNLSQDELASMLGTRRQAVNRELRAMETLGAVRLEYGRIVVIDDVLLDKMAARGS